MDCQYFELWILGLADTVFRGRLVNAFYARPQKYVLGLNDEQFDRMVEDKWGTYIGSVLLGTVNEQSGTAPTVGQLAATTR